MKGREYGMAGNSFDLDLGVLDGKFFFLFFFIRNHLLTIPFLLFYRIREFYFFSLDSGGGTWDDVNIGFIINLKFYYYFL